MHILLLFQVTNRRNDLVPNSTPNPPTLNELGSLRFFYLGIRLCPLTTHRRGHFCAPELGTRRNQLFRGSNADSSVRARVGAM